MSTILLSDGGEKHGVGATWTQGRQARSHTAKLLEAARAMVREKGYARTTLEAVARRAGMTTGAIYGNFKNRDELFIALGETYWAPVTPRIKPGATFAEVMHAMAEATLEAIRIGRRPR